ncbi:MAG: hypothetical protein IJW59_04010 [Clostridia bacterium]|nr:hypothetical protein [Clostridia bacterium]
MKNNVQKYLENKNTKDNALFMGDPNDIARASLEDAYAKLAAGKKISRTQVPQLRIPVKPDNVFVPKTTLKGEIYGFTIDKAAYLEFLTQTLIATVNPESNYSQRVYKGTQFYKECMTLKKALTEGPAYLEPNGEVFGTHIRTKGGFSNAPIALSKEDPMYAQYVNVLTKIEEFAIDPEVNNITNPQQDFAEMYKEILDEMRTN